MHVSPSGITSPEVSRLSVVEMKERRREKTLHWQCRQLLLELEAKFMNTRVQYIPLSNSVMSVDAAPLPPLEPLVRSSTKRTRAIFASSLEVPKEEERRC